MLERERMASKLMYDYETTDLVHSSFSLTLLLSCDLCLLMVDLSYDVLTNICALRPTHGVRS